MKRYLSVMEILESYLKRQFHEQQERLACIFSVIASKVKSLNR
ncbi:hypothetical protein LINPERPRIM_LOCUS24967 [Linum perenne]